MKKIILTGSLIMCLFSFKKDSTTYRQVDCNKHYQYIQNRQLTELKELEKIIYTDHKLNEISTALAADYLSRIKVLISVNDVLIKNYHATFKEQQQPF